MPSSSDRRPSGTSAQGPDPTRPCDAGGPRRNDVAAAGSFRLLRWIGALRLLGGIPVPSIHHEAPINRPNVTRDAQGAGEAGAFLNGAPTRLCFPLGPPIGRPG